MDNGNTIACTRSRHHENVFSDFAENFNSRKYLPPIGANVFLWEKPPFEMTEQGYSFKQLHHICKRNLSFKKKISTEF